VILLLFGPPGCGKGTQATSLADKFHIPAISTGEMFRAECKAGTELGKQASAIMQAGGLVGDDIVNDIVASRISRPDCKRGFLLDGYPRTVPQAQNFGRRLAERGVPEPVVIHLDVRDSVLVARLTARRQCPQCLKIYNLQSQPPRIAGYCDDDGSGLLTREDDQESVIRDRLYAYSQQTGPILDWYGPARVHTVDGDQPAAQVARSVEEAVIEATGTIPAAVRR
jgi:adenylate kinase